MAGQTNHKKDVIQIDNYKKKTVTINVGLVLFGVIFLYLVVTVFTYMTKNRVASYEVREGSILTDTAFTGIAMRQESVIYADTDGYVNFFTEAGKKASVGMNVYTSSPAQIPNMDSQEENQEVDLSGEDWNNILMKVQSFHETYNPQEFKTAQSLKADVTSILQSKTTQNRTWQLNTVVAEGSVEGLSVYQAPDDGVIEYTIDGYENLSLGEIDETHIGKKDYTLQEVSNNTLVNAGTPVYKLITSEEWTLVIKLSKEMEEQLKDTSSVKVRFMKDNEELWGTFQIFNKGKDDAYGYLTFSKNMIRYASDRHLDVELILEDQSGLKIPKSSVVTQEFYKVPEEYLTSGGASNSIGVLCQTTGKKGAVSTQFKEVNVFYRDSEKGMVYIRKNELSKGDILFLADSNETFTVEKTAKLRGVYNINKGYAVLKQVNILCESEEYYIVEQGNKYGLSNYDHIALIGKEVQENDIVSQ